MTTTIDSSLLSALERIAGALEERTDRPTDAVETWQEAHPDLDHTLINNLVPSTAMPSLWERLEAHLDAPIEWSGRRGKRPDYTIFTTPTGPLSVIEDGVGIASLDGVPLHIDIHSDFSGKQLFIATAPDAREAVTDLTATALREARTSHNLLRGHPLLASLNSHPRDLRLRHSPVPPVERARVAVDDSIWSHLDIHVHAFLRNLAIYPSSLIGGSRGILISGPPGVGKSMVTRVIATEVADETTVIWAEADVVRHALPALYDVAADLAPSLVILDDLDLAVGQRQLGGGGGLPSFLTTLDRMADAEGVVTIATTNVPEALDKAAVRSSRIGHHLTIPLPDTRHRRAIIADTVVSLAEANPDLQVSLTDADLDHLADTSDGATGADLKERVITATLTHGRLDSETLARPTDPETADQPVSTGNYL